MIKFFLFYLFSVVVGYTQSFDVEKLSGNVKILSSGDETWQQLKPKMKLDDNTIISTDINASVTIKNEGVRFSLKESSAITVSNIKKMSLDELIMALAMDNVLNTPRKKGSNKSDNTAVYGDKITSNTLTTLQSNDFGIKRINGAKQLVDNGLKESAIITVKEVYRKYPTTKKDTNTRIYFADILFELGLYEEAYDDYADINKTLELSNEQKNYIDEKLEQISKKLINK